MNSGDGRSTSSMPPVRRSPHTILGFAVGPKELVCLDIVSESGNVLE